jgi:hypothetical protein
MKYPCFANISLAERGRYAEREVLNIHSPKEIVGYGNKN